MSGLVSQIGKAAMAIGVATVLGSLCIGMWYDDQGCIKRADSQKANKTFADGLALTIAGSTACIFYGPSAVAADK